MERFRALQGRPQRADDCDFQSIEDPGDAQSDDDQQVKPAPGKPIETERDVCPDHGLRLRRLHRPDHFRCNFRSTAEMAEGNRLYNALAKAEFDVRCPNRRAPSFERRRRFGKPSRVRFSQGHSYGPPPRHRFRPPLRCPATDKLGEIGDDNETSSQSKALRILPKISRLHLDRINVQIRNVYVLRLGIFWPGNRAILELKSERCATSTRSLRTKPPSSHCFAWSIGTSATSSRCPACFRTTRRRSCATAPKAANSQPRGGECHHRRRL